MYTESELNREMYGDQAASTGWRYSSTYPPSPDRYRVDLGQPLKYLSGEPTPLALWCLFAAVHGKKRKELAVRYFGKGKRGPK